MSRLDSIRLIIQNQHITSNLYAIKYKDTCKSFPSSLAIEYHEIPHTKYSICIDNNV